MRSARRARYLLVGELCKPGFSFVQPLGEQPHQPQAHLGIAENEVLWVPPLQDDDERGLQGLQIHLREVLGVKAGGYALGHRTIDTPFT